VAKVQDISFSQFDNYMATLGGMDDNAVVVWNAETGEAICGSPAHTDTAFCVKWLNGRNDRFVTAGTNHSRIWQVDFSLPKLHPMDVKMGQLRRTTISIAIEPDDHFAYCGTETGDVMKLKIDRNEFKSFNDPDTVLPSLNCVSKERYAQGIRAITLVPNDETGSYNVLASSGGGDLMYMSPGLRTIKEPQLKVLGGVTSLVVDPSNSRILVGTDQSNIYELGMDFSGCVMKNSCHVGPVHQVVFPEGTSDLCITSGVGDIRVWSTGTGKELLRVAVPNLECHACQVTPSGAAIVSGWTDGKVRAFSPESGKIKFVIPDAHTGAITALVCARTDSEGPWPLVTGGADGRVRIWRITSQHQAMEFSLKEHRGPINRLIATPSGDQCISASADGSCIVWDIARGVRTMAFFEPNVFKSVVMHPDESQILTCGTNHKITYWDVVDGQAIREIEGADDFMNCIDIDARGEFYVTGSDDKNVKIWHYDEGLTVAKGKGHSGAITAVAMSPDQRTVVSAGRDGDLIFWRCPSAASLRDKASELLGEADAPYK
jgi:WD40 repeat protein